MSKYKDESDIVKKVDFTNILINKDFSKYETSLKNFKPDINLSEIFKEVFETENADLELSEIDEIRKIYFLYFKKYMDQISDYKLCSVEIPALGRINPDIEEICKYVDKLSRGATNSSIRNVDVLDYYNNLIAILKVLIEKHQVFFRSIDKEDLIKYDIKFLEKKNKKWKQNFYKRNIKFKEEIFTNGLFF